MSNTLFRYFEVHTSEGRAVGGVCVVGGGVGVPNKIMGAVFVFLDDIEELIKCSQLTTRSIYSIRYCPVSAFHIFSAKGYIQLSHSLKGYL